MTFLNQPYVADTQELKTALENVKLHISGKVCHLVFYDSSFFKGI